MSSLSMGRLHKKSLGAVHWKNNGDEGNITFHEFSFPFTANAGFFSAGETLCTIFFSSVNRLKHADGPEISFKVRYESRFLKGALQKWLV